MDELETLEGFWCRCVHSCTSDSSKTIWRSTALDERANEEAPTLSFASVLHPWIPNRNPQNHDRTIIVAHLHMEMVLTINPTVPSKIRMILVWMVKQSEVQTMQGGQDDEL